MSRRVRRAAHWRDPASEHDPSPPQEQPIPTITHEPVPRAGQSPAAATAPMPRSTAPATPVVIDVQLRSSLAGLRALGRAGLKPIAMAPTAGAAGMWSRHAHGRSVSADPAADRAGFAAGLAEKADAQGPLVAYPGREEAIDGLLDASKLSPSVVLPFPPAALPILRSKIAVARLAGESGLKVPATRELAAGELRAARLDYPCVLKPVRQPSALGSTRVVGSSEKLHELLLGVADEERLIVQPRTEGALVSLGLVVARDGRLVAQFQHLADRTWPIEGGSTARAVSVRPDPYLVRPAMRALELAGYWGLVEMEFLQGRDGAMLIDVNPRFYGCMALPLACGVNLPAAWHAVALDREPPRPLPYRTGVVYRWRLADVLAAVRGSPERLRERLHGPQTGAMWATDDPLPAPLMVGAELGTRVSRRLPGRFGASTPGRRRFRPKR